MLMVQTTPSLSSLVTKRFVVFRDPSETISSTVMTSAAANYSVTISRSILTSRIHSNFTAIDQFDKRALMKSFYFVNYSNTLWKPPGSRKVRKEAVPK